MIILGVDFGEARTGLAICDRSELLASPVGTIAETDFDTCVEKVAAPTLPRGEKKLPPPQKNGVQHVLWSAIPKI